MRDFKGMKRQRGRNRGGGGGAKPQQNANRAFDSNGPENIKVRGHAQHVFEKYQQLARDAASAGDRVLAENFLQHAEHYFRLLRTLQPHRPVSDFIARDNFASGYDIDFEDESGAQALPEEPASEVAGEGGEGGDQPPRGDYQNQPRENREYRDRDQNRDGQNRDGQNRDGQREGRDRWENRRDRDRNRDRYDRDRPRDDRPRDDRGYRSEGQDGEPRQEGRDERGYRDREDRGYRDDRPRDDRPREDRGYREDRPRRDRYENRDRERGNRDDRGERDPMAVIEPQAEPLVGAAPAEDNSRMLRSSDGEVSHAPAFLQSAAPGPAADDGEAAPVKRARGRPRKPKAEESTGEE